MRLAQRFEQGAITRLREILAIDEIRHRGQFVVTRDADAGHEVHLVTLSGDESWVCVTCEAQGDADGLYCAPRLAEVVYKPGQKPESGSHFKHVHESNAAMLQALEAAERWHASF
ncbi:hypothetical protein [Amycolatopsis sp. CA-230715]|uniref:hypothetical protein n=1 Tax=Amycolatopsis sp. CA-230715 TaxID=2745196 RepID=UPI001C0386B8|nr:hypothetical protein [Amycolatopsis sp. CA-230715]QWF85697.1 hypothetical protein HUW46_09177 [Amycolatopsis sp. CA-230715]